MSAAPAGAELLRTVACLGAVSAEAVALLHRCSRASARGRLAGCVRRGEVQRFAPLRSEPPLYTITRAGLRACGEVDLAPARVSAANAAHAGACARAAASLVRAYPCARVLGEPVIRREAARGAGWSCGLCDGGADAAHRPDLVLIEGAPASRVVAIEVELSVKAPMRLERICRAWARSRAVDGVAYLAAPAAARAVERAIARSGAADRVIVVPLDG
jgi:hypothetical protein